MKEIFTEEMIGKSAITSGGYPIGVVEDIVIETDTGEIKYLLVRPAAGGPTTQKTDGKGRSVVAINTLKISGDNIIVS